MKKNTFGIILAVSLLLAMTGCSNGSASKFDASFSKTDSYNLFKVKSVSDSNVNFRSVIDHFNNTGEANVTFSGTFITSFDGKTLTGNQFVAIYTDDSNNYNLEWGKYQVDDVTFGSATYGSDDLIVSASHSYLLAVSKY
jgi:hypothetical protein